MKIKLSEVKDESLSLVSIKVAPKKESIHCQTDTPTEHLNRSSINFTFDYETLPVRTIFDNSKIWFVLKDVCEILGIKNPRKVWNRLDEDERGVHKGYTPRWLARYAICK